MHLFPIELLTAIPTFVAEAAALDGAKPDIYPAGSWQLPIVNRVMGLGILVLLVTLVVGMCPAGSEKAKARLKMWLAGLLAIWTLAPPLWFAYEYSKLYNPSGVAGSWETFKHGQETWAKLWAGVVALLGVRLLAMKDADTDEEKKRKKEISEQLKNLDERLKKLEPSSLLAADPVPPKA